VRVERPQPRGAVELGARRAVGALAHEPARERDPIGGLDAAAQRLVDEPGVHGVHVQPLVCQAGNVSRKRTRPAAVAHDRGRLHDERVAGAQQTQPQIPVRDPGQRGVQAAGGNQRFAAQEHA